MKLFTEHPATVGETYLEHLGVATSFGLRMVAGGLGAIVHGFLPFAFKTSGSRTVQALHGEIVHKRGDEAQKRSVEYVI